KLLLELGFVGKRKEFLQLGQVGYPILSNRLGNEAGKRRIRLQKETPLGNTAGLVVEPLGPKLSEIRHKSTFQELGMECRHAVRAVATHNRQIGHANLRGAAFFD